MGLTPAFNRAGRSLRNPRARAGVACPLIALALISAGCSVKGADNPNLIAGKQQFVAKCGSCHTLARANTKGIVGPNLDYAFKQALSEGERRDTVRGVVEAQVQIPASPTGQLAYLTNKASATAGALTIEMPNTSGVTHNIAIEPGTGGASGSGAVAGASPFVAKGTATVSVSLRPGAYTFFCQVPGHRQAGMFGTLTVK